MGRLYIYPHLPYKSTIHGGKYNNRPMDPNGNHPEAMQFTTRPNFGGGARLLVLRMEMEVRWEKMVVFGLQTRQLFWFYFLKATCFGNDLRYHIVYIYQHIADAWSLFWKQIDLSWGISFLCKCCKSHRNKVQEFNAGLAWNPWILRMELDLRVAGVTLIVPWRWRSRKFLVRRFVDISCENFSCFQNLRSYGIEKLIRCWQDL